MSERKGLTPEELDQLKEYIQESRRLKAAEPKGVRKYRNPQDYYDLLEYRALPKEQREALESDQISIADLGFESYADFESRFKGVPATPTYSVEWEEWNQQCYELTEKYHDSIAKALSAHFSDGGDGGDTLKIIDEIIAAAVEVTSTFSVIRQGTATNALTKIRAVMGENTQLDEFTGNATIQQGGLSVFLPHFEALGGLKTSTYKLLDAITVALTESGAPSPTVTLSLEEYMAKCELKDRKEARKQAKADLETLRVASISFKEKRKKGDKGYLNLNITEAVGISRSGIITFKFTEGFYNLLLGYPVMPYPPQLWSLDSKRNPNSYYLLRKIAEHKNMNAGKKNEDTISIKTLLEVAPYLPSYDDVMKGNRNLTARIIEPFERDMDALNPTLLWNYCHSNNVPLSNEELEGMTYDLFKTLMVRIVWTDYPDQSERLEKKRLALEAKKKARKKGGNGVHCGG